MTSEQFTANFGYIANAPGGVGKLRDLIYHFAFAGELVAHSRENAAELAAVLAETASPTGRTRNAMLEPAAALYPIPPHWHWVNIGDIGHDWGQTKPSADFTYIDVSAIDNQRGVVADGASILAAANAPSRARKVVKKGTVIYSTVRPYLLNIAIIERDFDPAPIASTAFAILHPHDGVEAKFVYYFLRSPAFVAYVESVQSGIAYPAISDQKFFAASFPLAPTEEQKRIVAKVDELMALCDQLEAQQQERERRFPVLSRTSHSRFTEAPTSANLNRIFDETGSVSPDDLRKSILALAVQGKLAPQGPNDETAEQVLGRLRESATREGKSLQSSDSGVDGPYELPKWWRWIRLGELYPSFQNGASSRGDKDGNPVIVLRLADVNRRRLTLQNTRTIPIALHDLAKYCLRKGDILVTRVNGSSDIVGSFVPVEEDLNAIYCDHFIRMRIDVSVILPTFITLLGNSQLIRGQIKSLFITTAGQKTVNQRHVGSLMIPFPPPAEQRRIVAKVNELMAVVDHLEAQQQERDKLAEAFAKACVASFTGTVQLERPEKMKAPKTELVSIVALGKKLKAEANAPLTQILIQNKGTLPAKTLWLLSELPIDAFYQHLKTEIAKGWIAPPVEAEMKVVEGPTDTSMSTLTQPLAG
jgi:type I restriction enzyme S subunit